MKAIIKYFAVPKGEKDWRIVYDATASGLNECVWAPSFWLPTVDSLLPALGPNSWMADRDIGDMFLNFELHHSVWPYVGVDLEPVSDDADQDKGLSDGITGFVCSWVFVTHHIALLRLLWWLKRLLEEIDVIQTTLSNVIR